MLNLISAADPSSKILKARGYMQKNKQVPKIYEIYFRVYKKLCCLARDDNHTFTFRLFELYAQHNNGYPYCVSVTSFT